MPANMVLIEKITVGAAGASSVTFSGIPQTGYTDLVVKFAARGDAGAISRSVYLTFNGSATSYSSRYLQGDGSAASSGTGGSTNIYAGECTASTATASTFANQELYIPNYASSNYKSVSVDSVAETNATTQYMGLQAGLWSNTAAITSIGLAPGTGNFAQYSTFYLYGVAKLGTTPAIVPYATGGDTIMTDGTYWYHTFLSSGTFTPRKAITCDYLVVAGGGGGSGAFGDGGGGGGAGGYRTSIGGSPLSLGTSAYTVTVGAGGATNTNVTERASSGSDSVFSTITSTGGGGGSYGSTNGGAGGSGGGSGRHNGQTSGGAGNTPSTSPSQGNNGGNNSPSSPFPSGGGGGSSAAASNASGSTSTAGGAGTSNSISGTSVTYAGGGGGAGIGTTAGAGGAGGGGAGNSSGQGTTGTANTGGGGGGSAGGSSVNGANGGSGIVIVRYAV